MTATTTTENEINPAAGKMSLINHLRELRNRVFRAAIALAIGTVVGFILYNRTLDLLIRPYCHIIPKGQPCVLRVTDPLEQFAVRMKLSAYVGFLIASPFILWQVWKFITPGLYEKEKKYAIPFVFASVFLFFAGAAVAYWTIEQALTFFTQLGGDKLQAFYSPGPYLRLISFMMLAFGLCFEFPIVLIFLQLVKVLTYKQLVNVRRYAIVGIWIFVAVATPSGDPYSLTALSVPMCLFYEIAIFFGWMRARRKRKAEAAA